MRIAAHLGLVGLMLSLTMASAWSQTAPAASAPLPPVGSEPATTTAAYGDWVLRCQAANVANAPSPAKRICEVVLTMQVQGQQEPVAQVAFGKGQGGGDLHLVVALPVNVTFPSTVAVSSSDKDPRPLVLDWKRCIPGACFADAVAMSDVLGRWRTATAAGQLSFKDASGRQVAFPLSFRGLAPALDALSKAL